MAASPKFVRPLGENFRKTLTKAKSSPQSAVIFGADRIVQKARKQEATMKKQRRWIKSAIETARKESTSMPWQRGARRTAAIAQRAAVSANRKTA